MLDHALHIQMTYGAVMLSFLGALHWGFELAGYGGQKGCVRLRSPLDVIACRHNARLGTAALPWERSP